MGKFITIGKCNKLYKYICYYLIIKLIYEYLFDGNLPKQIKSKYLEPEAFPKTILVQESFNYLGTFIFSIILYRYEMSQIAENKENKEKQDNLENDKIQKNLENEDSINSSLSSLSSSPSIKLKKSSTEIELIYNDSNEFNDASGLSIGIITILLTISVEIMDQLYVMDLRGLDFWMFEILFISFISYLMFGKQVYRHKKFAICFITVIPCLFKALSIIEIIKSSDDENGPIFVYYKAVIIPLGIVIFLLLTLLRDYSICKIKYFLDYKYASINRILIIYGFYGSLICFISSIISTNVKCKKEYEHIKLICTVDINNGNLYYDHFKAYFKDIWRDNRVAGENFIYIILMLFKIFNFYLIKLFSILIIKKLNQVYLICSTSIFYFFLRFLRIIFSLILKENESLYVKFLELMAELFSIIGIIFYLELIEFNFCGLNYNLKKNITIRSLDESYLGNIINDDDDNESEGQRVTELSEI